MDFLDAGIGLEVDRIAPGVADGLPEPGGLRRLDARSAHVLDQKSAGEQRLVAEHLGVEPVSRSRDSSRLAGSFASFSGVTRDDCRYAADITSRFMNRLTSQPSSRNVTASQSRSSGWLGASP